METSSSNRPRTGTRKLVKKKSKASIAVGKENCSIVQEECAKLHSSYNNKSGKIEERKTGGGGGIVVPSRNDDAHEESTAWSLPLTSISLTPGPLDQQRPAPAAAHEEEEEEPPSSASTSTTTTSSLHQPLTVSNFVSTNTCANNAAATASLPPLSPAPASSLPPLPITSPSATSCSSGSSTESASSSQNTFSTAATPTSLLAASTTSSTSSSSLPLSSPSLAVIAPSSKATGTKPTATTKQEASSYFSSVNCALPPNTTSSSSYPRSVASSASHTAPDSESLSPPPSRQTDTLSFTAAKRAEPLASTRSSSAPQRQFDFFDCPPAIQRKCFSSLERLRIAQAAANSATTPTSRPQSRSGAEKSSRLKKTAPSDDLADQAPYPPPILKTPIAKSSNFGHARFKSVKSIPKAESGRHVESVTDERPRSRLSGRSQSLRRKHRAPTPASIHTRYSPSDAEWFRSLPRKIQYAQFSEEERAFLSQIHEPSPDSIADASDQRLLARSGSTDPDKETPQSRPRTKPRLGRAASCVNLSRRMDDSLLSTLECLDNKEQSLDFASTLDDYHQVYTPESTQEKKTKHSPSFRKVMSFSSLALAASAGQEEPLPRKSTTSSITPPPPPIAPIHSASSAPMTPLQRSKSILRHQATPAEVFTPLDSGATHYKDPSARLKLRVYLGSPQKFDEAIEFGFPSLEDSSKCTPQRPPVQKRRQREALTPVSGNDRTFLNDSSEGDVFDSETPDDDDDDDDSQPSHGRASPYTPQDSTFNDSYLVSPSIASPHDSPETSQLQSIAMMDVPTIQAPRMNQAAFPSKPVIRYDPTEPLAQVLAGNREMTLRMTLTRPDLRDANESDALGTSRSGSVVPTAAAVAYDPLSLDALPAMPDQNGSDIWDTLPAAKESGLRKIWRKVSGKPV